MIINICHLWQLKKKERKKHIILTSFITCDKDKMYIWRKKIIYNFQLLNEICEYEIDYYY